jgi:hypothetical protein
LSKRVSEDRHVQLVKYVSIIEHLYIDLEPRKGRASNHCAQGKEAYGATQAAIVWFFAAVFSRAMALGHLACDWD